MTVDIDLVEVITTTEPQMPITVLAQLSSEPSSKEGYELLITEDNPW